MKSNAKYTIALLALTALPAVFSLFPSESEIPPVNPLLFSENNNLFLNKQELGIKSISDQDLKILQASENSILAAINRNIFKIGLADQKVQNIGGSLARPTNEAIVSDQKTKLREIIDATPDGSMVLFKHTILVKKNNGFEAIPTNISWNNRFVSMGKDSRYVYLGTAVNGLYYAELNPGNYLNFRPLNGGLPFIPHEGKIRFYEEIRHIHITHEGDLVVGTGIKGGIYIKWAGKGSFEKQEWPENWQPSDIYFISSKKGQIWVSSTRGLVTYLVKKEKLLMDFYPWQKFQFDQNQVLFESIDQAGLFGYHFKRPTAMDKEKSARMETAKDKKLFYTSLYNLKSNPGKVYDLLQSSNFNGVVIDVKDDHGYVLYKSAIPFLKEQGAVRSVVDLSAFITKAHQYSKYVVARVVVFKDPVLFRNADYAIWDKTTNSPWVGNPRERWVDPYNPDLARQYYGPLVQELEDLGVDEIQLDYIRFPGEGELAKCLFRYKKGDKYLSEAIEDFLIEIRKSTRLPLGIDVFGYQGLYRTGGFIGQDMEAFGKIVDVISPMLYSSHFGDAYLTDIEKEKRVYRLIRHSIQRAEFISSSEFIVRPYLQAFPMKNHIWGYGPQYFLDQIEASRKGSGYSFWGTIENMLAVDSALNKATDDTKK